MFIMGEALHYLSRVLQLRTIQTVGRDLVDSTNLHSAQIRLLGKDCVGKSALFDIYIPTVLRRQAKTRWSLHKLLEFTVVDVYQVPPKLGLDRSYASLEWSFRVEADLVEVCRHVVLWWWKREAFIFV